MVLGLSKIELPIAILLLIYILGNFKTPIKYMFYLKTVWPGLIMLILLVYLFMNNHGIIFLLYVFAIYEFMRRSDKKLYDEFEFFVGDVLIDEFVKENFEDEEDEVPDSEMSGINDEDHLYPMPEDIKMRREAFQNGLETVPLILDPSASENKKDDMAGMNPMVAQALLQGNNKPALENAKVIEEFTSLLGKDSLEKKIIDKKSPIGHSTTIKYKSTPYKPLNSNLTGASLI